MDLLPALLKRLTDPALAENELCASPLKRQREVRSNSIERRHFRKPVFNRPPSSLGRFDADAWMQDWQQDPTDLHELIAALEGELASASHEYGAQLRRISGEAEQSARMIGFSEDGKWQQPITRLSVQRACHAWIQRERRRRERQGLPLDAGPLPPRNCARWAEERAKQRQLAESIETKVAQLAKLRRVLHNSSGGSIDLIKGQT